MHCFSSTYNIASASTFYPSRPKNNPQNHPHFTRLKIRRSADPHFTGGRYRHLIARRLLIMIIFVGLKIVKMSRFICCSVT